VTNASTPTLTPTVTYTPTETPTPSQTYTPTSTPSPTNTPVPVNSGWINPTKNAAATGGDGNGFQTTPVNAYANDTAFAVDTDSGTTTGTGCANTGKDRHVYHTYNFSSVPAGSTILGIEVRLDMKVDATTGAPKSCVELSWDSGATWTAYKTTTTFTTSQVAYILGGAADDWGHAWTTDELGTLRVRITNVASNNTRDFSLEWVPVRVTYLPSGGAFAAQSEAQLGTYQSTGILDSFDRADGPVGGDWSGDTAAFGIQSGQLSASGDNAIYWNTPFGPDQEASVTFSQVDADAARQSLLLKSQSSSAWGDGVIEVSYDAPNQRAQVWTYDPAQGWVQHDADIPVTFENGDTFGARATSSGTVEVYRNGLLLATCDITTWPHFAEGGYIGLRLIDAGDARLDNFSSSPVLGSAGSGLFRLVSYQASGLQQAQETETPTPTATYTPAPSATPTQGPSGPMTIDYVYDGLNRLTEANYSNGDYYHYIYDAVGNVLQYAQSLSGSSVTTTYAYDDANQMTTAQMDNSPVVWQYHFDANGQLTEILPDGNPANGAKRYTFNTAGYLTEVETHEGSSYELQAEMFYDGLGHRLSMTAYTLGTSVTTNYSLDLTQNGHPLSAASGGNSTVYLSGIGPLAEFTTSWSYSLPDGTNTPRQLTNDAGTITLAGRYTPWGDALEYSGTGNFTFGYFGGLMDSATGLLYVGNGQYYDPATGRFLARQPQPEKTNPYVPWNPIGAIVGPLGVVALLFGRRKKGSKTGTFLVLLLVLGSLGMTLAACGPAPSPIPPSPIPPTIPPSPSPSPEPSPTNTPDPNKCNLGYGCTAYLTFDDGPDPLDFTTDIAFALLNPHNAKATFFITAVDNVENGLERYRWVCADQQGLTPDWKGQNALQILVNSRHAVGLHGLYHEAFGYQADNGYYLLTAEEEKFREVGIVLPEPVMVRSPELGWGTVPIPNYKPARYYDADIISDDDKGLSSEGIVKSVETQLISHNLPDNPIILLHSTYKTTYDAIVRPLPNQDLMATLKNLGYSRFESLPRPNDPINTIIGRHFTGW
jgi:RHS repeat-associated protein